MKEAVIDISRFRVPHVSGRVLARLAGVAFVLVLLWNSLYQVSPDELGAVTRFGRFVRTSGPGLQAKLPFLEQVQTVPVQRQLRQEFGFRSTDPANKFDAESTMLTGDLNVAVVEWIVQYRVADPYRYLFRVGNVDALFRDMTEAVMQQAVGDRTLTEVVTVGRQDIETAVQHELQALADAYETGLRVDQVVLQNVSPPDPVKPSWDEVNQAQQQRDRLISQARADYNRVIPRASGEAAQALLAADGYGLERVNQAEGDAARFRQLQEAYAKAPDVTRRRLQLETMTRVLPKVGGKIVIDKDAKGVLPLLPLDNLRRALPDASKSAATAKTQVGGGE